MSSIDRTSTVGSLVSERPSRAKVFEQFGLDYCCGGHRTLGDACADAGVEVDDVVAELERAATAGEDQPPDWASMGIADLVDHIEATHHAYTKEALARIDGLVAKVLDAHGGRHPQLRELASVYRTLRADISQHLMKEEQVLHPMCRELDRSEKVPDFHCGSLANPIRVMDHEHEVAGALLSKLRELTGDYNAPDDACNTWLALYDALAELEADLHLHIHKENNLLYPQVLERESTLAGAS